MRIQMLEAQCANRPGLLSILVLAVIFSISPQTVSLAGTGAAPIARLSPTSLTFASQAVGNATAPQAITLSNTGNTALSISSIAITGVSIHDFTQTNTCGSSVAGGSKCMISVTFTPTAIGGRSAGVALTDNAAGSVQTVSLAGTGTSAYASPSPSSLSFAGQPIGTPSAAQAVTLTNTGNSTLTISSIALTGSNSSDFAQANNCGSSLAAGANCTISVTLPRPRVELARPLLPSLTAPTTALRRSSLPARGPGPPASSVCPPPVSLSPAKPLVTPPHLRL